MSARSTATPRSPSTASPAPSAAAGGRKRRRRGPRRVAAGYLFVAPFLIVFVAMLLVPLGYAAYLSVFRQQLVGGTVFVGLDNYVRAFGDGQLIAGILRVGRFFLLQVPVMLSMALLFALALDSGLPRLGRLFRLGFFVPYAVPSVVAALMWGYLYGPDFGPVTQLAEGIGLEAPRFFSSELMLGSLANIVFWEFTGYNMVILYAALRAIPQELYEAAAVDGAGAVRTAWSVKIPAIRPALLLTLIFSVIGSFQLFNEVDVMENLAPGVVGSSYTPNYYAYQLAFVGRELNYAAAVSFLLGAVIFAVSYTFILATRRRVES